MARVFLIPVLENGRSVHKCNPRRRDSKACDTIAAEREADPKYFQDLARCARDARPQKKG